MPPDPVTLIDELRRRVEDLGWDFAYALNPGCEHMPSGSSKPSGCLAAA